MNNLKHLRVRCLPIDDIKGQILHIFLGTDKKHKELYYLDNGSVNHVDLEKGLECTVCTDVNDVIHAEYMPGHNKITISTKKSISIIDCDNKAYFKWDVQEIQQTSWSNNFDHLAVLFADGQLSTYTFDSRCDLLEQATSTIHAPVPQQLSVGWGSQNTQFQGPSVPNKGDTEEPPHMEPTDNKIPIISWRGNGDEFVVSYIDENVRIFKIFDSACSPKAQSEALEGILYGPIAWKPQGNIIAAAIFHNGKNYVGLFERNGLFRMHFPLVDVLYPISSLSWSFCGRVLVICQEDNKGNSHLCLYTTCNMKWFLKQHLIFNETNPLGYYTWIPTDQQCLELMTLTKCEAIQYKYKFQFDYDHDSNMIVAINGKSLRIHAFLMSIDPSPSCTSVITVENPVNMIAFHPDKDLFAAIDSENIIYCFTVCENGLMLDLQAPLGSQEFPLKLNHLFWRANSPYVLVENTAEIATGLYEFNMEANELVKIQQFDVLKYPIEQIYAVNNIIVKHDAKYRTIHRVQETPVTSLNISYPYEVLPLKYETEIFSLVLNPNQDLFIEDELVCRGITSMLFYRGYLLLTDNTNLYTLKLSRQSVDTLAVGGLSEFHSRPLNELAYLVCMMGDTSRVILHTPRGNLEIISCRSMQTRNIEEMLARNEWAEAIRMMRLERLDWNLLIDLDAERFYKNISQVVEECDSLHTLNAIVAEINDENCLTTVYKNTIDKIPYVQLHKKRVFFEKLSDYLDKSGLCINYLPTVLKICLDQNNIQKAMMYLSFLIETESEQQKLDQSIAQVKTQVEGADIFKAALFTFNLPLAEYVAEKCQIDPQEVGPLLQEMKGMDDIERRIYLHTKYKNWDTAVAYMLNREQRDKDAILEFITEHDVAKRAYMEAIKLKNLDFVEDIAKIYIQKLIEKKQHNEAGVLLVKYSQIEDAIQQFKLALDYKKCVEYIPQSSMSDDGRTELFTELATKLVRAQRVKDAAKIYETQLGDYTKAIEILANGGFFTDALRIAKDRQIDIMILPKMFDMLKKISEVAEETGNKFMKCLERLKKLRNDKKFHFEKVMKRNGLGEALLTESLAFRRRRTDGLEKETDQEFELQSVVSQRSSRSTFSSSTTVTQKQIRKMEKQRQDTTEGSKFEDIALMREMHIMISLIFKLGPEAKELFLRLIEYSAMDLDILHQLHERLYDLQVLMRDEVHNIWDEEFRSGTTVNHINENYFFMDEQYRIIPPEIEDPGLSWALEMFKN